MDTQCEGPSSNGNEVDLGENNNDSDTEAYDEEDDEYDEDDDYFEDDDEYDDDDYDYDEDEYEEDDDYSESEDDTFLPRSFFEAMVRDDDDDESACDCPECIRNRMVELAMRQMLGGQGEQESGGEENEGPETLDEPIEEQLVDNPDATPCAVCMSRRPLVTLPCCGGSTELTSTTRFCSSCVEKWLKSDGCPQHRAWTGAHIGECPRCKQLIVRQRNGTLKEATTRQILSYLTTLRNPNYLPLLPLLFACDYLPSAVFQFHNEECLAHLCRWGLVRCNRGLYSVPSRDLLRKWVAKHLAVSWDDCDVRLKRPGDKDDSSSQMALAASLVLLRVSQSDFFKKPFQCLRLLNRVYLLVCMCAGLLPIVGNWRISDHLGIAILNCLNVLFVYQMSGPIAKIGFGLLRVFQTCCAMHFAAGCLLLTRSQRKGRSFLVSSSMTSIAAMWWARKWITLPAVWTVIELGWPLVPIIGLCWLFRPTKAKS